MEEIIGIIILLLFIFGIPVLGILVFMVTGITIIVSIVYEFYDAKKIGKHNYSKLFIQFTGLSANIILLTLWLVMCPHYIGMWL